MPPVKTGGSSLPLPGQRPVRRHLNRLTQAFFAELDKGVQSPLLLLGGGLLLSYVSWRVTVVYLEPRRELLRSRPVTQRVPMTDAHNVMWGVRNSGDRAAPPAGQMAGDGGGGTGDDAHPDAGRYVVQRGNSPETEEELRRPQVVYSEASELRQAAPSAASGAVDLVVLELSEYDPQLQDDVYYRSLHYLPASGPAGPGAPAASSSSSADAPPLNFADGGGDVIHGMVKCKGVTSLNNCVPAAGHVEEEVARKLLLALGPVHLLRDSTRALLPLRLTLVRQQPVETLVLGLHSGELPRWLASALPNFSVTVVESDGALVRLCKQFCGLQESSNLRVVVGDPLQFVRQAALPAAVRRDLAASAFARGGNGGDGALRPFDLVIVNAVDGSGHLSTRYARLDFISGVRNAMSDHGVVAVALPNRDGAFVYNAVQNWRMGFQDRAVLLVHCVTQPYTVLLTFQDNAARGKSNFGSVGGPEELRDVLRAMVSHYGAARVPLDLPREVGADNLCVLEPGARVAPADVLPRSHPARLAAAGAGSGTNSGSGGGQQRSLVSRVSSWISAAAGAQLSPTQRADLRAEESSRR